jgi:heat shock protein HslJ
MKRITLIITGVLAAALLLSACSPATPQTPDLAGTSWKLVSYGPTDAQITAMDGVDTSLKFSTDGQVSGTFGCNSFGGDYSQDGNSITFGPIMSTMMACDDARNSQDQAGFAVLQGTVSFFYLEGDSMSIHSADGKTMLLFSKLATP